MADRAVEVVTKVGLSITYEGAGGNYDSQTSFPRGLKVKAVKFYPSAAGDILTVRDGSATGGFIAKMKDVPGGGSADISFGEGVWCKPYILLTDCTFTTIGNVIIVIVLA